MKDNYKIKIQTLHFDESETLKKSITDYVEVLFHQYDFITKVEIILSQEILENIEMKFCEIRLLSKGTNIIVKKKSNTFESAVFDTLKSLQKILKREKLMINFL